MQRSCVSVAWRVTSGIKAVKETEHHLVNSRIKAWLIDDKTKENWTLILERQSIFEFVLHKIAQPRGAKKFHAPEYFHHSLPRPSKKTKTFLSVPYHCNCCIWDVAGWRMASRQSPTGQARYLLGFKSENTVLVNCSEKENKDCK